MNKEFNFQSIKTWYLDCDGVLLDSNKIKTDSFYDLALPFGVEYANSLIEFHKKNGGISRFVKVKFFVENILNEKNKVKLINDLTLKYGQLTKEKLLTCSLAEGFEYFIENTHQSKRFVVSGGLQQELIDVFRARKIFKYFDGIYGSPKTKLEILDSIFPQHDLPAIFVGDAKADYQAAISKKIPFIFLSQYSEFSDWSDYFKSKQDVLLLKNLSEIFNKENCYKQEDIWKVT